MFNDKTLLWIIKSNPQRYSKEFAGAVLLHNGLQGVLLLPVENLLREVPQQMEALPEGNRIALG